MLLLVETLFVASYTTCANTASSLRLAHRPRTVAVSNAVAPPPVSTSELQGVVVPTGAAAVRRAELDAWREYEGLRADEFALDSQSQWVVCWWNGHIH